MDASALINRPADVTRSTVQKAVVVIADNPQTFGTLRERLSVVTHAWFAQREFTDTEILRRFQESLADEKERGLLSEHENRDAYLGMSLREMIHEFKWQTLVLLKCCLLQPKVRRTGLRPPEPFGYVEFTNSDSPSSQMLFFGSRCERLCMMQFSLISLIPGLIRRLQDCADPELNSYEKHLTMPTNLKTSDRSSLQAYMGLPLQIFGKVGAPCSVLGDACELPLTENTGKPVWTIYTPSAARCLGRPRDKIVHCWKHQFSTPPAARQV